MQHCSECVGDLAAALAKAQTELTNPEKSLSATIAEGAGELRSFRYAPLSRGLEIVRNTLGRHSIAVLQSTMLDESRRLLVLSTTLAHSSGQWVSSEWPVCRFDQPLPQHRMGAALTYARRYALFSLVGLAGEDDLDAPDLQTAPDDGLTSVLDSQVLNGGHAAQPVKLSEFHGSRRASRGAAENVKVGSKEPEIGRQAEATQSGSNTELPEANPGDGLQELLAGIEALASLPEALEWARRAIGPKNRMATETASVVERAFAEKIQQIQKPRHSVRDKGTNPAKLAEPNTELTPAPASSRIARRRRIDKSALSLGEPKRLRDRNHLRFVASRSCLVCGRQPCDAHHLRFAQLRALGLKVSDEFTVPLCRGHHREAHRTGDEAAWWGKLRIDALNVASQLWGESHGREIGSSEPAQASPLG